MPHLHDPAVPSPQEALQRLREGNRRFRDATAASTARPWSGRMASESQQPFAIVLGCSDSRTPVEILFDQGFGELFVVRVAGNVVAPSIVGSIEFAASQFGSRLVVVMGHSQCGAITATVDALRSGAPHASRNIRDITDRIAPHVAALVHPGGGSAELHAATLANVRASVDHLRHGSRLLEELVREERLVIVGAEYRLETGEVRFLDEG
jgi:carbonic anhydrase